MLGDFSKIFETLFFIISRNLLEKVNIQSEKHRNVSIEYLLHRLRRGQEEIFVFCFKIVDPVMTKVLYQLTAVRAREIDVSRRSKAGH